MTKRRGNFASVESIAARLGAERISDLRRAELLDRPPTPEERRRIAVERAAVVDREAVVGPARIQRDLARSLVLPGAAAIPCAEHAAEVGRPCFGRAGERGSGSCAARVRRGIRGRS